MNGPRGYQRIATFNTDDGSIESVSVLYQGRNHYDALEFLGKSGEWVPRTQLLASMGGGHRMQKSDAGAGIGTLIGDKDYLAQK